MKCNKCKSSNVQKYQVIHEQGTSNIDLSSNTVGGGVGFGGGLRGGVGLGRTGTSGKSQTLIAEKTQPPKDIRVFQIISFLVVGAIFFAFFIGKTSFHNILYFIITNFTKKVHTLCYKFEGCFLCRLHGCKNFLTIILHL